MNVFFVVCYRETKWETQEDYEVVRVFSTMQKAGEYIQSKDIYFVELDAEINFNTGRPVIDGLFIGGSVKTYMQPGKDDFFPVEVDYPFNAGFRYKWFEAGYRRLCIHPVDSRNAKPIGHTYGGLEEFYIRIRGQW